MAKIVPTIIAAALCALVLRSAVNTTFVAPQLPVAQTVHQACRPVGGSAAAPAFGAAPAIISAKPARPGVAAHFTVKLQTPDGEQSFECPDDVCHFGSSVHFRGGLACRVTGHLAMAPLCCLSCIR